MILKVIVNWSFLLGNPWNLWIEWNVIIVVLLLFWLFLCVALPIAQWINVSSLSLPNHIWGFHRLLWWLILIAFSLRLLCCFFIYFKKILTLFLLWTVLLLAISFVLIIKIRWIQHHHRLAILTQLIVCCICFGLWIRLVLYCGSLYFEILICISLIFLLVLRQWILHLATKLFLKVLLKYGTLICLSSIASLSASMSFMFIKNRFLHILLLWRSPLIIWLILWQWQRRKPKSLRLINLKALAPWRFGGGRVALSRAQPREHTRDQSWLPYSAILRIITDHTCSLCSRLLSIINVGWNSWTIDLVAFGLFFVILCIMPLCFWMAYVCHE